MRTCVRVRADEATCDRLRDSQRSATILHADLDSFYASVEQRDDAALRGRPVIVGGGVVLAASYEAKAYGVRTAMGGRQARQLCPHAIVVPPRMSAYSRGQRRGVRGVPRHHAPRRTAVGRRGVPRRGRAGRVSGTPVQIAARLRERVRVDVGLPITVGIARTKFLAKVASQEAKPDGLLLVPPDRELAFLHPLPVRRLWGVGAKTAEKLQAHGIHTVADVAELSEANARVASSAGRWAASCSRCRATSTGGVSSPACAGVRSARNARSVGRETPCRPARSTPSWSTWSTASPAGCARPAAPGARWCCGCGSTTSAGPPGRTPCRAPRRPPTPSWPPPAPWWPRPRR